MPPRHRISSSPKRNLGKTKVLTSKVGFKGPLFTVVTEQVREPGGYVARRDIVRHPGSVVIMAIDESKAGVRVLLERQYRHAARGFLWELPAGKIDPRERPLAAAKRELLEETGYRARRWLEIMKFYVSPGFLDETMAIFFARGIQAGTAQPEADELIQSRFFSLPEALRMIKRGAIRDAKTIAPLYWLTLYYRRS